MFVDESSAAGVELGYAWMDGGAMFRAAPSSDAQLFYASLELRS